MRVLLVINAVVDEARERDIAAGQSPRKDYLEMQRSLCADILDLGALERQPWTRAALRLLGASIAQSLLAWTQLKRYDAVFADRETTGFLLAILAKLRPNRPRLVMIGHLLSPIKKRVLFRMLRLQSAIDCIIVHSSLQERLALSMGLTREQVELVPYQTDEQFWTVPDDVCPRSQICSAGLEYRDYETLTAAVTKLDVEVVIAAASHWSRHRLQPDLDYRSNIQIRAYDYLALRNLYSESLFVVVPLHDIDNQAGITTILEAMSMSKAVIVSHSRGQTDVVRDRRTRSRVDPQRPTQPDWIGRLGAEETVAQGQTGIYVTPGNPEELRKAIVFLLTHPEEARIMGANGRRVIEATMTLDQFAKRVSALIVGECSIAGRVRDAARSSGGRAARKEQ